MNSSSLPWPGFLVPNGSAGEHWKSPRSARQLTRPKAVVVHSSPGSMRLMAHLLVGRCGEFKFGCRDLPVHGRSKSYSIHGPGQGRAAKPGSSWPGSPHGLPSSTTNLGVFVNFHPRLVTTLVAGGRLGFWNEIDPPKLLHPR